MEQQGIADILPQVDLFSGLDENDFSLLAGHFSRAAFGQGEVIIREGGTGHSLSIIIKGEVEIVLPERQGSVERFSEIVLTTLGPGEIFGEYAMVDLRPASASVVVKADCELFQIDNNKFRHLLDGNSAIASIFYHNLLVLLIDRLRHNNEELDLFAKSWN